MSTAIKKRRLALPGHVARHNDPANKLLFLSPEEARRRGRSNMMLKDTLEKDTG